MSSFCLLKMILLRGHAESFGAFGNLTQDTIWEHRFLHWLFAISCLCKAVVQVGRCSCWDRVKVSRPGICHLTFFKYSSCVRSIHHLHPWLLSTLLYAWNVLSWASSWFCRMFPYFSRSLIWSWLCLNHWWCRVNLSLVKSDRSSLLLQRLTRGCLQRQEQCRIRCTSRRVMVVVVVGSTHIYLFQNI